MLPFNLTAKRDLMAIFTRRAILLGGAGTVAFGAIGSRLLYLQTLDPTDYAKEAENNRYDARPIVPLRGVIYDRFGTPLALSSPNYRVTIRRELAKVDGKSAAPRVLAQLGVLLSIPEPVLAKRLEEVMARRPFEDVLVKQELTWDEFAAVNVRLPELPGVTAEVGQKRFYPYTAAFAHPIGYVQKPTRKDIDAAEAADPLQAMYLRNPDVRVGKAGIETALERALHGEAGSRLVEVNAQGRVIKEEARERRKAKPGAPIVLTLDSDIQRFAMERMSGESAACVVMDIWDGDLIALASSPGFDPNLFVNGIGQAAFKELNESEFKPLFHKCVTGAYKPGSTFKIVTATAAISAGIDPDFRVNCPGYYPFGGRAFHCWKRGGHGVVDMRRAIQVSCNVFFYQAAQRAGQANLAETARRFGFGEAFDIGAPNVHPGLVPDEIWWAEKRKGEPWPPGMTLNTGIGQGDLLASPLQLAVMTARLANGGLEVKPRLVREGPGVAPAETAKSVLPGSALKPVTDGVFMVCNVPGGTAMRAGDLKLARGPRGEVMEAAEAGPGAARVQIAGKTGTAQVRVITAAERARGVQRNEDLEWRLRDHALFVCYGPVDQPRYACAVVVEHGGGGSAAAAPIASDVIRQVLLRDPSARKPATVESLTRTAAIPPQDQPA